MKAKFKNITGGSVYADIEMSDTPKQAVRKVVDQNSESDAAVIFCSQAHYNAFKTSTTQLDTSVSSIFLETQKGQVPLEWEIPLGEQIKAEFDNIAAAGRDITFVVSVAMIVAK